MQSYEPWEYQTFETNQAFLDFLGNVKPPPSQENASTFTSKKFVRPVNTLAKSIRDTHFANAPLLVFKATRYKELGGHITDTHREYRPDYTAAFEHHWASDSTTLWPCVQLAGEKASKEYSRQDTIEQAFSHLYYLLLARPDLHVAQGWLIEKKGVMFVVGIGGMGIRCISVAWTDPDLYRVMYAFIYRLYEPGDFRDPSYVGMVLNREENYVTFTIRVTVTNLNNGVEEEKTTDCPGFRAIYAANPFESRTHILSNPESEIEINGKKLRVVKDQLCKPNTQFKEFDILTRVHDPENVPGVAEAVFHQSVDISPRLEVTRGKHRIGLRQIGSPFTSGVRTVKGMLELIFDVLEVLRYLRFSRQILHRDISNGNVLYLEEETTLAPDTGFEGVKPDLCFIKCLLNESTDPLKTSVLLVDFNHAEHLDSLNSKRPPRTGTPLFIARAVEQEGPVILPQGLPPVMPAVPISPSPYTVRHPGRIAKFPHKRWLLVETASPDSANRDWRHELDNDAESVFWLLVYWSIARQPAKLPNESIKLEYWEAICGPADGRIRFIETVAGGYWPRGLTHSAFQPLSKLLKRLADFLVVDRHWLDGSEPRHDPEYIPEAFQRSILQFILDNLGKEFMTKEFESIARPVEVFPRHLGAPETESTQWHSDTTKKRRLSSPSGQLGKRPRLAEDTKSCEDEDEADAEDEDEDEDGEDDDDHPNLYNPDLPHSPWHMTLNSNWSK